MKTRLTRCRSAIGLTTLTTRIVSSSCSTNCLEATVIGAALLTILISVGLISLGKPKTTKIRSSLGLGLVQGQNVTHLPVPSCNDTNTVHSPSGVISLLALP